MTSAIFNALWPRRRWLQFRLRTLIIVIGLTGLWLGWWANSATRQRQAVRAILDLGGSVSYDYQFTPGTLRRVPEAMSPRPQWMQWLLDDNYFHNAVAAGLDEHRRAITDMDLICFEKGVPHLRALYLGGNRITDAGLEHLKNLKELEYLVL